MKQGTIIPIIAIIAPKTPLALYPAQVAIFPAIIPGIHWLIAKKSTSSSSLIQFLSSTIYFFNNGKFILQHTVFDGGTTETSIVISEGLWSGNSDAFENGGTIQTTEYMYRNYETSQNGDGMTEVNFGNAVIVTDLITSSIEIIKEDEYSDPSLSFTSRNGLSFSQVH